VHGVESCNSWVQFFATSRVGHAHTTRSPACVVSMLALVVVLHLVLPLKVRDACL
jgi:hypothetical protein